MSNLKKTEQPSTRQPKEGAKKTIFEHLQEMNKNSGGRFGIVALLLVGLACLIASPFAIAFKGGTAMLYMFANNGKLSGRADGNVYMKNGRIRGMKVPALVQNAYTQAVRAALGSFAASFRALTADQIAAWNAATGFYSVDRFGRTFVLNGKALYQSLNQNLFSIAAGPILDVPAPTAVPGITDSTATVTTTTLSMAFSPSPTDTDVVHVVMSTIGLSAGVSKPSKSAYRQIGTIASGATTPQSLFTSYVTKFGTPVTGQKIFFKLLPINKTTGQAGPAIVCSDVVA